MNRIKDPLLRDFAWDLCRIWKDLGRKVGDNPWINLLNIVCFNDYFIEVSQCLQQIGW